MTIKIHAIRTGSVQVKTAQPVRKTGGLIRILTDSNWTEWLPIFAWVIDHPEGIIVVDTGETARTSDPAYFPKWHPYHRKIDNMGVTTANTYCEVPVEECTKRLQDNLNNREVDAQLEKILWKNLATLRRS